ncbi:hypothetical protein [Mycobacteroides chelonae]|uniref:hypothetical protein n=1 Tax=Mycobacteroides chelonae TaxID=1774 RepID=UPI00099220A0|nr:hypothetical protein [Mycobacteroides chelonae]
MAKFEFNEFAARSAAKSWGEVGKEMAAIAATAKAITDGPWGGGELGDAFSKGDNNNGFVSSRNTVQTAGDSLATYLASYGTNLSEAADLFAKQTGSGTQDA